MSGEGVVYQPLQPTTARSLSQDDFPDLQPLEALTKASGIGIRAIGTVPSALEG